jgi:predicted AAA+ superfamily ATPase
MVFTALRRITAEIYYHKTNSGLKVDFIARMPDGSRMLVQVCESLAVRKTRKREIAALNDAMLETGMDNGIVVTRHETGEQEVKAGKIDIVPVWRFFTIDRSVNGKGSRTISPQL